MSRPEKPEHYPRLMPYLTVVNAHESIAFYQEAFKFELGEVPPIEKDGEIFHVELFHQKEACIMFGPENVTGNSKKAPITDNLEPHVGLFIYVKDVDNFYKEAIDKGATSLQAPEQMFWGDKMCRLKCINGYEWSFATNVADFDPKNIP